MNMKAYLKLPILVILLGVMFAQFKLMGASAETAISAPIEDPVSAPIDSPTPEPTLPPYSTPSSDSGNSGSGDNNSPAVCNETVAPASAPKLISVVSKKPNQVVLTWEPAGGSLTHYFVSYGTNVFANEFGNPNVGGPDTTSYTVGDLSGKTVYFFRIVAMNGCIAGDSSNVLSVKANGRSFTKPATNFKAGVLAAKAAPKAQSKDEPKIIGSHFVQPTFTPKPVTAPSQNIFQGVSSFLGNLFHI